MVEGSTGAGVAVVSVEAPAPPAAESRSRRASCGTVEITVLSLRPELMPIYRRFGFVETGTEEFHYPHPLAPGLECHCVVMEKTLR